MRALLLLAGTALLLAACVKTVVPPPKTGEAYFREGETLFDEGRYEDAIAEWEKVRETYQSAELMTVADFRIAEAHYLAGNTLDASLAFAQFLEQHPQHKLARDAMFLLGLSYYEESLSPDRDQTATRNAISTFTSFLQRYPSDTRAAEAEEVVTACRDKLASHELYVGTYYFRTKSYAAAIGRLASIPADYPDFERLDRVLLMLGQAHLRAGNRTDGVAAFNQLYERFPGSKAVTKAQEFLAEEY